MDDMSFVICTYAEAQAMLHKFDRYWAFRPPADIAPSSDCIYFATPPAVGRVCHEVGRTEVENLIERARRERLICAAFRSSPRAHRFSGICFTEILPADKTVAGTMRQTTNGANCIHCGLCIDVCTFGARVMDKVTLVVDDAKCRGCGICAERCPIDAIKMERRS